MLLCTKTHFIKSLERVLCGEEGLGSSEERKRMGQEMKQRITDYASDGSGFLPGPVVLSWNTSISRADVDAGLEIGSFSIMVNGICPRLGQRIVYVDGGFDLFSSGHIEFLRQVVKREDDLGHQSGWFSKIASETRIEKTGEDYGPAFVIAGIHDDAVINHWKGVNYPIMNIFERGLCVLQCRVSLPTLTIPLSLFTPIPSPGFSSLMQFVQRFIPSAYLESSIPTPSSSRRPLSLLKPFSPRSL